MKIFLTYTSVALIFLQVNSFAQNYNSLGNGTWTTAANWENTSGWGNATPASGQSSGTTNVNHTLTFTGNYSSGSATININSGSMMIVTGDFTTGGGSTVNIYGMLRIAGDATLNSTFRIHPGGKAIINGSMTVVSSNNLIIGTNVAPPSYADLVIKQNLISQTSGDVTINQNGRVAVYGDVEAAGGGTLFTVNNGGQIYIDGDISFSGGGSHIYNNNSTDPYGLYVNGTISNTGGGSSITANTGDLTDLQNTNPDFFDWLAEQEDSPLPVELVFFLANTKNNGVNVKWATASQLNFDYFSVEHSLNSEDWNTIARIDGEGTTNERLEYTYQHDAIVQGINYYRLKSIDLDGAYSFSSIVAVNVEVGKNISAYPNPATSSDQVSIKLNYVPEEDDVIVIVDGQGSEIVRTYVNTGVEGISLPPIKAGIYLMNYIGKGFTQTTRIMIK